LVPEQTIPLEELPGRIRMIHIEKGQLYNEIYQAQNKLASEAIIITSRMSELNRVIAQNQHRIKLLKIELDDLTDQLGLNTGRGRKRKHRPTHKRGKKGKHTRRRGI
jgi:hypothetical protein